MAKTNVYLLDDKGHATNFVKHCPESNSLVESKLGYDRGSAVKMPTVSSAHTG